MILRVIWAIGAIALGWAGASLLVAHPGSEPLWWCPAGLLILVAWWRSDWALTVVLACLPIMDRGVHAGWTHLSLWDAFMALACAGLWWRRATRHTVPGAGRGGGMDPAIWLVLAWVAVSVVAWWRAPVPAWGPWHEALWGDDLSWFAPWQHLKGLFWALALLVGIWADRHRLPLMRALAWGMWGGLVLTIVAVCGERAGQVGVLDVAQPYRTTAWFWEMGLGGGAIDAYLAMSLPFAWWGLLQARRAWQWWLGACVLVGAVYAVVTTYSRGILAVAAILGLAMYVLERRRAAAMTAVAPRWFAWLHVALLLEALGIIVAGQFAADRFSQSSMDAVSRWRHWTQITTLAHTPAEQVFGIGLGQLPRRYSQAVTDAEIPGRWRWHPPTPGVPAHVQATGAPTRAVLAGRATLVQRLPADAPLPDAVVLAWRAPQAVTLRVDWCEQHLLFAGRCRRADIHLPPASAFAEGRWTFQRELPGEVGLDVWRSGAPHMLRLSVVSVGASVDLAGVRLERQGQVLRVDNARFESGLAHWWRTSVGYFLPWHADNLYLEVALERGVVGWGIWVALLACAVWRCRVGCRADPDLRPLGMALLSLALLGALISMMEFPRIAFLAQFLMMFSALSGGEGDTRFSVRSRVTSCILAETHGAGT